MAKLQIRIDDDTKAVWLQKAEEQGTTLTALIVSAVDGIPVKRRKMAMIDPALLRQIAQIGNNLNQIAKWANRNKQAAEAMAVIAPLIEIERELTAIRKSVEAGNAN